MNTSTQEEYEQKTVEHEAYCDQYQHFLDRIVDYLNWQGGRINRESWKPSEIKDFVESEIRLKRSLDAPNPPGYYRANND